MTGRLRGDALWMGASWGGRAVLPILALALIASRIGPAGVAEVALALGIAALLAAVVDWGSAIDGPRRMAAGEPEAAGVAWRTRLAVAMAIAAPAGAAAWAATGSWQTAVVGTCLGTSLGLSPLWIHQGLGRLGPAARIDLAANALGVGAGLTVIALHGPAIALPAGIAAGSTISTAVLAWLCRERIRGPLLHGGIRSELARGARLGAFRLLGTAYGLGNPVVLAQLATVQQLGWFVAAERMARVAIAPVNPLTAAWSPLVAARLAADADEGRRFALRLIACCIGCGLLAGLSLALAAPMVARAVFGDGFAASLPLLPWLGITVAVIWIGQSVGLLWHAPRRHDGPLLAATACACATNLAVAWIAVPHHGALGMAWALLAAETVAATILLAACLRKRKAACASA